MDDKITIIEGPPPIFEGIDDGWAVGLNEGPFLYDLALTRLRTFNSASLIERCHRAWNQNSTMYLHFRNDIGLEEKLPIMAARSVKTSSGDMLMLWIRLNPDDSEIEMDIGEDGEENEG